MNLTWTCKEHLRYLTWERRLKGHHHIKELIIVEPAMSCLPNKHQFRPPGTGNQTEDLCLLFAASHGKWKIRKSEPSFCLFVPSWQIWRTCIKADHLEISVQNPRKSSASTGWRRLSNWLVTLFVVAVCSSWSSLRLWELELTAACVGKICMCWQLKAFRYFSCGNSIRTKRNL